MIESVPLETAIASVNQQTSDFMGDKKLLTEFKIMKKCLLEKLANVNSQ